MTTHYCPKCLTLTLHDQPRCEHCQDSPPVEGWPETKPNRYAWLGTEFDHRYRLVQFIGFGSTGEVYRTVSKSTGRNFAVKVIDRHSLPRSFNFEEVSQRLLREVSILGRIRSPYVVPIFDFLQQDDDLYVLIMDLALGPTLERMIFDQGWLPFPLAFEIAEQLLEALGDVHDQGIVHRDLKPENIVVQTLRSGRPFIRLLDFGVAKEMDEPSMTHGFVGTPLYSAPEQFVKSEEVDQRADLYSVGGILVTMLTGKPPFSGQTILEVMQAHLNKELQPISRSSGNPQLDSAVDRFLNKAMTKNRDERYNNAAEMLSAPVFDIMRSIALTRTGNQLDTLSAAPTTQEIPQKANVNPLAETAASLTGIQQPLSDVPYNCLAISSAGDIGASVSLSGELISQDLLESTTLATDLLPQNSRPRALFFAKDEAVIVVVTENGWVAFYEPLNLNLLAEWETGLDEVIWAGPSSRLDHAAILLSRDSALRVDIDLGLTGQVDIEPPLDGQVSAASPAGAEGHRLYFEGQLIDRSLLIRESMVDSGLDVAFDTIPQRIIRAGRIVDVSARGVLLVEKRGQFFEFDQTAREFRSRTPPSNQRWRRAFWLAEDAGLVMLAEEGALSWVKLGAKPIVLHPTITDLAVSRDRLRIVMVDTFGNLLSWQPILPALSKPKFAAPAVDSTSRALWDIAANGSVVCARSGKLHFRQRNSAWARLDLPEEDRLVDLRLSEGGSCFAYLTGDGDTRIHDLSGKRIAVLPAEGRGACLVSTTDSGGSVCLCYKDGTLVGVTPSRTGKANVRWRRQNEKSITAMRISQVAERVITGHSDGSISLFDLLYGGRLISLPNTQGTPIDFGFSIDGHMFVVLHPMGMIEVYDSSAGRLTYRVNVNHESPERIMIDRSGNLLVAQQDTTQVELYDVQSAKLIERYGLEV